MPPPIQGGGLLVQILRQYSTTPNPSILVRRSYEKFFFGIFRIFCYTLLMKRALVVSLALLSASAFASFELGIITDATTGFHRFDLQTGIYLGSFGSGFSNGVLSTWTDQPTSTLYSMSTSGIRKWNYSTGEYLGVVNFGASSLYATNDPNGNFYTVNGSNTISVYNLNGTDSTIAAPAGVAARWVLHQEGRILIGDSANGGRILRSTASPGVWTVVASGLGVASMPATSRHAVSFRLPGVVGIEKSIYVHDTTATDSYYGFTSNDIYQFTSNVGIPPITQRRGAALGHFGTYFLGNTAVAGQTGIIYLDEFGNATRTYTSTAVANPQGMTVVLAPEPGTMLALGAGLALLTKRRKATSNK